MTIQHIADTLRAKHGRMRAHVKAHERWSYWMTPSPRLPRDAQRAVIWGAVADLLMPEGV